MTACVERHVKIYGPKGIGELCTARVWKSNSVRLIPVRISGICLCFKTECRRVAGFILQGRHGWTLRLRDSINLSVHLSEAAVKPYPTPVSTLNPRNLVPE